MIFYAITYPDLLEVLNAKFPGDVTRTDEDGTVSTIQVFTSHNDGHLWVAKLFNGSWVYCYDEDLFAGDPDYPTSQGRPMGLTGDELYYAAFAKFAKCLRHWINYKGVAF